VLTRMTGISLHMQWPLTNHNDIIAHDIFILAFTLF
jgi:hypothetical protein